MYQCIKNQFFWTKTDLIQIYRDHMIYSNHMQNIQLDRRLAKWKFNCDEMFNSRYTPL